MTTTSPTEWHLQFASKEAAAAGTEGPFYELSGGVLFPEVVEVLATASGRPYVRLRLEIESGRVICTSIDVTRAPGGEPIEAATVRDIDVKGILDAAVVWESANARAIVDIQGGVKGEDGLYVFSRDDTHDTEKNALAMRRQRSVTDELLREVAEVYLADTLDAPTLAVEIHFDTSNRTATRWVRLARQRGFIPPYERPAKKES